MAISICELRASIETDVDALALVRANAQGALPSQIPRADQLAVDLRGTLGRNWVQPDPSLLALGLDWSNVGQSALHYVASLDESNSRAADRWWQSVEDLLSKAQEATAKLESSGLLQCG